MFIAQAFITRFTGFTDKWFYKLIKNGGISKTNQTGPQFPLDVKRGGSLGSAAYQSVTEVIKLQ